jgi:ubiquinone/menaquinone biosynthesis C-methylase UbiE
VISTLRSFQESFRHRCLANILSPYLKSCHNVLDVGAASGRLAQRLWHKQPRLDLVGVDVLLGSQVYIPMVQANGKRLPFASSTFDCVILVDVLHHDRSPRELLAEAGRVSRDHIYEVH